MGKKISLMNSFLKNDLRVCEFALTNLCTAKCSFCSIWKQKKKIVVNTRKALKTITHLSDLGVRFITLTGGEPLLHKDYDKIVAQCTKENIISSILNADARLFTSKRMDALKEAGIDYVGISIDHYTNEVEYKSRKIPKLLNHIEKAVKGLKKRGIKTTASILISDFNHKNLEKLFQKCKSIGFDTISINYPEFSESPVYTLGGDAISLSKKEVIKALEEVIRLKKKYDIVNPIVSMKNIILFLKGEKPKFMCFGGYRTLFIDWNFNVYPCMHLANHMGDVLKLKKSDFKKIPCNKCNMSWYRDFSVYFHGLKSIIPLVKEIPNLHKY